MTGCISVEDPTETSNRQHGILEIKCPYSARTMTPETACEKLNQFCCSLVAGQVTLKKTFILLLDTRPVGNYKQAIM